MEEILSDMVKNPHIHLPMPISNVAPSISTVTKLLEIDAKYRIYQRSGILKLYGKDTEIVVWYPNVITTGVLGAGHNTLSFSFSGCCMARYSVSGKYYTAHIHCDKYAEPDCRYNFIKYIDDKKIYNFLIFRPLMPEDIFAKLENEQRLHIWGLISKNNNCYTLCLEENENGCEFKIICIVQHIDAQKNRGNLKSGLFTTIPECNGSRGFSELRQRWDVIFRNERCDLVYVDKGYRRCLQRWRK